MPKSVYIPELPEKIEIGNLPTSSGRDGLVQGCYFVRWVPLAQSEEPMCGTMRIERLADHAIVSGDLYFEEAGKSGSAVPIDGPATGPRPSGVGIPIFPRSAYRKYLRVTRIVRMTNPTGFAMRMQRSSYDVTKNSWTSDGHFFAELHVNEVPSHYPSGSTYLEGNVSNPSGKICGTMSIGWISNYLRSATIEIDRVSQSEFPANNGMGLGWEDVFKAINWKVDVFEGSADVVEPSGESWCHAELQNVVNEKHGSWDLDKEWRCYLICIRQSESNMPGTLIRDPNRDPRKPLREGAFAASHWVFGAPKYGDLQGKRLGKVAAPYFRTAVHEIGHTMGLLHNFADTGFMSTTGKIACAGEYPANINWSFHPDDAKRLRHRPDPWVRPGSVVHFNRKPPPKIPRKKTS